MVKNVPDIFCNFKIRKKKIKPLHEHGTLVTSASNILKTIIRYYASISEDEQIQSTHFSFSDLMKSCPLNLQTSSGLYVKVQLKRNSCMMQYILFSMASLLD